MSFELRKVIQANLILAEESRDLPVQLFDKNPSFLLLYFPSGDSKLSDKDFN